MDEQSRKIPTADQIEALIEQRQLERLRQQFLDIHPADIADILDEPAL